MLIPFPKLMQCALIVATMSVFYPGVTQAQEPSANPALTVTVQTVNSTQIIPGFGATGNVRAWHDASVSAQTSGLRLKALYADVGDRVKVGQMLAEFEDTSSRGDLTQAEALLGRSRPGVAGYGQAKCRPYPENPRQRRHQSIRSRPGPVR
ncbi:RND family efflux transporter MFP subunit [Advenella kashmirensis WT001]|uniref:RND family efflux transporter MFP subunit n=1 Tax=Advenella kashmirensis (strain DSM 17095 / LMG 22695 / WT001) TaxID=1036672 RepID=I3UBH1_ADVKW|nr:biotin/lipoyl-binding protein [Advenella kashmirensis]AFK62359.1 RND family efflux transporter MFP subunit [Advenella kashmirensis WT001]